MMRCLSFLTSLILLLPGAANAQDWIEPDDVREFAKVAILEFDTPVSLASEDDIDWYRIAVPRSGRLSILGELDSLIYTLTDADGQTIETDRSGGGFNVSLGLYYLSIQGAPRDAPYIVRTSLEDVRGIDRVLLSSDEVPLAEGRWPIWSGTSAAPIVFQLTLDEPSQFTAKFRYSTQDTPRYQMRITDASNIAWPEPSIWSEVSLSGPPTQFTALHLPPGTYSVSLFKDQLSDDEAEVEFLSGPPNDGYEPNDTGDFAREITANGDTIRISLFPGDEDWFYFETDRGGLLELTGASLGTTEWRNVPWPDVLQDTPSGSAIAYDFSQTGLARYWLPKAGRYYLRARANSAVPIEWILETAYQGDAESDDLSVDFFVMGLEPGEELAETLERVANSAGGESLPVSSDDMEMGLTLARIVGSGDGRDLDTFGYAKAASQVMNQRLFALEREPFEPGATIGTQFLADRGVFEPIDESSPSLARHARDTFTTRILSPFHPKPDAVD